MLREGDAIGSLTMRRQEVQPFTDKQIALLKIFADQAVIAIENVRLLTELQTRNRALTEALEQQTATSEILKVISSSPTDTQPVFDAIIRNAVRLCGALYGAVYRLDGEVADLVGHHNVPAEELVEMQGDYPRNIGGDPVQGAFSLVRSGLSSPFRTSTSSSTCRRGSASGSRDPRRSERPDGADAAQCGDSGRHWRDPPRGWRLLAESRSSC